MSRPTAGAIIEWLKPVLKNQMFIHVVHVCLLLSGLLAPVLILTHHAGFWAAAWSRSLESLLVETVLLAALISTLVFTCGSALGFYFFLKRTSDKSKAFAGNWLHLTVSAIYYGFIVYWSACYLTGHLTHTSGRLVLWSFGVYLAETEVRVLRQIRAQLAADRKSPPDATSQLPLMKVAQKSSRHRRWRVELWKFWWRCSHRLRLSSLHEALLRAVVAGNVNNVDVFLRRGADPSLRVRYDVSLLQLAVGAGQTDIVRLLLEAGADANTTGRYNRAPVLLSAVKTGRAELIHLLLQHGADANAAGRHRVTALMRAAREGDPEIVRALLAHGADVHRRTKRGTTALALALESDQTDIVALLQQTEKDNEKAPCSQTS